MITLYHCVDARSFRALWALEEVGVPYELKMLPFPPRYFAREYLEVNPLGTIPLLIDGETRMTESAAICQYLAERYAGPEPPERRLPQAVEDYARWTLGRLAGFESPMAGADYAAAGRFTVADISVGYALMMLKFIGLFEQAPGSLRA